MRQAFEGRRAFRQAVRDAFSLAARVGVREIVCCAPDFADWPLGERATLAALGAWAYSHRRLTLLAADFDALVRLHPRFVEWQRTWAHVAACRRLSEQDVAHAPTLLLAPGAASLLLADAQRARGVLSDEPADAIRWRERVDAIEQRAGEKVSFTPLGL